MMKVSKGSFVHQREVRALVMAFIMAPSSNDLTNARRSARTHDIMVAGIVNLDPVPKDARS